MTTTLDDRLSRLAAQIDDWMRPYLVATTGSTAPFYHMLGYHVGWASADGAPLAEPTATGKRLRPALAILVCEALGGDADAARGPAVAVELVHNFSLVHDDIQDRSDYRRGRETVWHIWGASQGINVGDAMFALAQLALVDGLGDSPRAAEAVRRLNWTCLRLVEGQFLDLHLESVADVSLEQYIEMVSRKTAALIECSSALGALAADADEATIAACATFGRELGLAFQFQDDALGAWGDPAQTGKPAGGDVRSRKKSLPIVLALRHATGALRVRLERLFTTGGPLRDGQVTEIFAIMEELGVRKRAEALVEARFGEVERAIRAALPAGRQEQLLAFCARLRHRVA